MTSKIYTDNVQSFLTERHATLPLNFAVNAQKIADVHGTVEVQVDGLITYVFSEDYGPESQGGYHVQVQNALV